MQKLIYNVQLHCESCGKLEDNLSNSPEYGVQPHNFWDTIPLKPLPHRLNSKTNQVMRRGLSHQWTYLLFPPDCEVKGMTEQRQRGVQSILKVLSQKGQSFHSMATALQMPTS